MLGIDIGTSFLKGAVVDLERLEIRDAHRLAFPGFVAGLGALEREVDPYEVVTRAGMLLERLAARASDCTGIVICGQMHSMVLVDEQGEAVSNCISWSDQRALAPHPSGAGSYFDVLAGQIGPQERGALGNEVRASLPLSTLFCMREQHRLPSGVVPASLPDFVASRLCHCLPVVEPTQAAAFGAFDTRRNDWHRQLIAGLGLDGLRWPQVRATGDVIGQCTIGSRTVPCHTPVGDQQCALAGALLEVNELSLNISTGSQVARIALQLAIGDYQTRPYFDGKHLKTITHIPAGRALNSLIRLLSELADSQQANLRDPWPYIEREASAVPGTDVRASVSFYPGPCGEGGAFHNLHENNLTVGHLFRAAFQSMARNYLDCALRLEPERNWERVVYSGGLARRSQLLCRLISEELGAPSRLSPNPEDTLFGLLILALVFSGRCGSVEEATAACRERVSLSQ